ncbi:MAG: transcription elongation factor GreA [Alphaproteobacteria bacterium]|jgi:transcription elongation factor GreA
MQNFPMTAKGFAKLTEELKHLKTVERPSIIKAIAEARALGDLSENAEYHSAREKQSFIEGRIIELEDKIARSEVIDISKLSGDIVKFGATVKLIECENDNERVYQIVGEYEANLDHGLISIASPLARAIIGKKIDDTVEVITPNGVREYQILEVEFK